MIDRFLWLIVGLIFIACAILGGLLDMVFK